MDSVLRECVEQACEKAHLGRIADLLERERILAEALAELEIEGAAMRYVDAKGRVSWRATKRLRDHLEDLRLDAEADFEHEDT
jgi:hypothetical protein